MNHLPFDKPGQFYKGNLHTHCDRSDGGLPVEAVVQAYADRGYDFLSITDHFLPNSYFGKEDGGFCTVTETSHLIEIDILTIPGAELHGPAMANGEMWHVVAVGLPVDFPEMVEGETGMDVVRRAKNAGAWISLAHPHWNSASEADARELLGVMDAIEVYNTGCDLEVNRGWSWQTVDALLNTGDRIFINAADDAHLSLPAPLHFLDGFGGWVQVKATERTSDAILAALKAGEFYSSTGPELLDVRLDGDHLLVKSSPVQRIVLHGHGAWNRIAFGTSLIEARLSLPTDGKSDWVRVSAIDEAGRVAFTNPIWMNGG